ncbi:pseudouridine synthase, partial [Acinetobacter baumannii]
GKKLYELARRGVEIERRPVKINVSYLEIIRNDSSLAPDEAVLRLRCSAGTYVRTLAEDIGRAVGTGAHLTALRRTRAGKF